VYHPASYVLHTYFIIIFRFFNIVSSGGSKGFCIFNNTIELYILFLRKSKNNN